MNHFREMLNKIRGEDFDIEYLNLVNRWAQIVGNGLTERDAEDRDLAPYLARTFKGRIWFEREYRECQSLDGKCGLKTLITFLDSLVEEVIMGWNVSE